MGDKQKFGHIPDIYSLTEQQEIVEHYEQVLAPRLKLGMKLAGLEPRNQKLEREIVELKTRLDKLLSLLERRP